MGLLDFEVDEVLARLEADFSDKPPSILALPNRKVSLQCPTAAYPAVSNHEISLQGPTDKYPCSAQAQSIPGVPNSKVSIFLQRICSAARKTVEGGRKTLHFLCYDGLMVGMLEVNMGYPFSTNKVKQRKVPEVRHWGLASRPGSR